MKNERIEAGKALKGLRDNMGITQKQLAETAGYKTTFAISKFEKGEHVGEKSAMRIIEAIEIELKKRFPEKKIREVIESSDGRIKKRNDMFVVRTTQHEKSMMSKLMTTLIIIISAIPLTLLGMLAIAAYMEYFMNN